jgi:hypothetical protein
MERRGHVRRHVFGTVNDMIGPSALHLFSLKRTSLYNFLLVSHVGTHWTSIISYPELFSELQYLSLNSVPLQLPVGGRGGGFSDCSPCYLPAIYQRISVTMATTDNPLRWYGTADPALFSY